MTVATCNDYNSLQDAVLRWLARPGDPLLSDDVPLMIQLFEAEATRRLFTRFGEYEVTASLTPGTSSLALPALFAQARSLWIEGSPIQSLTYISPEEMESTWVGSNYRLPNSFTIRGGNFYFAPVPDAAYVLHVDYIAGIPPLATAPLSATTGMATGDGGVGASGDGSAISVGPTTESGTNWLILNHPDCYLFGTLVEAEARIGNDERLPLWQQRREQSFASILAADRKARWGGSALVIRGNTGNP